MTRHAVIRVPGSGPPALIGAPNNFATKAEADARAAEVEAKQGMTHHTHLEVFSYAGDLGVALDKHGILR